MFAGNWQWRRITIYVAVVGIAVAFLLAARGSIDTIADVYLLPLLFVAFAILFSVWRTQKKDFQKVVGELKEAGETALQRERERDSAQDELFRRLYEQRELNKEKLQFQGQLAEYEKYAALAQLALGAAHEINNPLLGILSHLELELKKAEGEERAEIEQCIDGAKRISSTLRGLLNYARPGPLVLSKISVQRLIVDTLSFLEHQPMMRGKKLENHACPDLPFIRADANQISQVLMNLLLNAAQATTEGGTITISASKLTFVNAIEIRVSDTGAGIPADILPHIFEPFFTTKRGKGTGLGLSISQAYIRGHNGDIRVDSVPGHGTSVTITWPIRSPETEPEQTSPEEVMIR
jgi:two-component system NtrC family sensor kinase